MTFHFMGNDLAVIVNTMLKSSKLRNLEIMFKYKAVCCTFSLLNVPTS